MFTESPAVPYTASVDKIPAAVLNQQRAWWPMALDATGGGTWTNLAPITFDAGSAGWVHLAPFEIGNTGTFHTVAGGTCTLDANTTVNGAARFNTAIIVDNGAHFQVEAGCTAAFAATSVTSISGLFQWIAGGGLTMQGASFIAGNDTVVTFNGSSGHVSAVTFGQYSTVTVLGGGIITLANGANFHAVANTSFQIDAGAFVDVTIGGGGNAGSLTIGTNGTTTLAANSTFNNAAIEVRTGPTTRSGNSAYEGKRTPVTPAEGVGTLHPARYCTIFVPVLTADQEWWLQAPPDDTPCECWIKRVIDAGGNAFTLTLRDQNTTAFVAVFYPHAGGTGHIGNGWARLAYTGTAWTVVAWGGQHVGSTAGEPF